MAAARFAQHLRVAHPVSVDTWLTPLSHLARLKRHQLSSSLPLPARWDKLCEINVVEHVRVLVDTSIVRSAWAVGRQLTVHGWIYALRNGCLRELGVSVTTPVRPNSCTPQPPA